MANKVEWTDSGMGNLLAVGDGFKISYRGDARSLGTTFSGDCDDETAILHDRKYYILNGDFRAEYSALIPHGYAACLAFFLSKPELRSTWSNEPPSAEEAA